MSDSSTPDLPDLDALRAEIDGLKNTPVEELTMPEPASLREEEPTPEITHALGSEKWDEPADEETTDV